MKQKLKQLGQNVFKLRTKYNMTLEELSEKTGIRKQYLIKIEKGIAYGFRISHLEKLANAFEWNLKELLKDL